MNRAVVSIAAICLVCIVGLVRPSSGVECFEPNYISCGQRTYPCYPKTMDTLPPFPSPFQCPNGPEVVVVRFRVGEYGIVPVTVENGRPLNYKKRQWGKGRQLAIEGCDFPMLVDTGLHSDEQLLLTETITGRPVVEITKLGKPEGLSGAGFFAHEEDIISVLRGDNHLVRKLGLTHRQLAGPLFHLWNLTLETRATHRRTTSSEVSYNGKWILFCCQGSRGWQESIFDDEILGMYQFEISRGLEPEERAFLKEKYPDLMAKQMAELIKKLTRFHTGEMVPYYIMRYGFYEGHTSYRADPIAMARIFGLKSLQQIEAAFPGRLYEILTGSFTPDFVASL